MHKPRRGRCMEDHHIQASFFVMCQQNTSRRVAGFEDLSRKGKYHLQMLLFEARIELMCRMYVVINGEV